MSLAVEGLGRFGDRRLEKGGRVFLRPWLQDPDAHCGGLHMVIGRARCSFGGFFTTMR
jgi:hypothetical protein